MRKSIFIYVSHWISLLRHSEQLDLKFEPYVHNGITVTMNTNEPVSTVSTGVIDPKHMDRKRSHIEIRKHGNRSATNTPVLNNCKRSIYIKRIYAMRIKMTW